MCPNPMRRCRDLSEELLNEQVVDPTVSIRYNIRSYLFYAIKRSRFDIPRKCCHRQVAYGLKLSPE